MEPQTIEEFEGRTRRNRDLIWDLTKHRQRIDKDIKLIRNQMSDDAEKINKLKYKQKASK